MRGLPSTVLATGSTPDIVSGRRSEAREFVFPEMQSIRRTLSRTNDSPTAYRPRRNVSPVRVDSIITRRRKIGPRKYRPLPQDRDRAAGYRLLSLPAVRLCPKLRRTTTVLTSATGSAMSLLDFFGKPTSPVRDPDHQGHAGGGGHRRPALQPRRVPRRAASITGSRSVRSTSATCIRVISPSRRAARASFLANSYGGRLSQQRRAARGLRERPTGLASQVLAGVPASRISGSAACWPVK